LTCTPPHVVVRKPCDHQHYECGAIALKNHFIYAIGGYNENIDQKGLCDKYDIKANKWFPVPILNKPRGALAASQLNDRFIYTFGGWTNDEVNFVEMLDSLNEEQGWISIENLSFVACKMAAIQADNKNLIIFGSIDTLVRNNYKIDYTENKIKSEPKMSQSDFGSRIPQYVKKGRFAIMDFEDNIFWYSTLKHEWIIKNKFTREETLKECDW